MKNIRTVIRMFQKLLGIMNKRQRRGCVGVFFVMLLSAAFETMGVSVVIPFVMAMLQPEKLMENRFVAYILNITGISTTQNLIFLIIIGVIGIYLIKNAFLIYADRVKIWFRNGLERDLSVLTLSSYMKRPYPYYIETNSSTIIRGTGNDIAGVSQIVDSYFSILTEILTFLFIGIFLFVVNPIIAIGIISIIVVCAVGIIYGFKGIINAAGKKARDVFAQESKCSYQAITGIKEIIVMQRRKSFIDEFSDAAESACKCNDRYQWLNRMPSRIIEFVFIGSLVILMALLSKNTDGLTMLIPQLGALAVASIRILPSMSTITSGFNTLVYYHTTLDSAAENIKDARNYESYLKKYAEKEDILSEDIYLEKKFEKCLDISNIKWEYKNAHKAVLDGLNMVIQKGDAVGFIGESGAGKTTLADAILGLLKPQDGSIRMDGIDIFAIPKTWARIVGYVPQSVFLTDDTIRRNIAFGIANQDIDETRIWETLEEAQMAAFVRKLPDQLDTIVGERGVKFSGGQRQRIAIARALYYNPDILVLDEATSALDNDTESAVMEAIDSLHGTKTLIIVAHRLSTIRNCNKIYEIKNGKAFLCDKKDVLCHEK